MIFVHGTRPTVRAAVKSYIALAADKERAKAGITGVEIAAQIIRECRPYIQGVHIMALGWERKVPEVLKLAGL